MKHHQLGFSLLEVMVALVILVIMAVGATGYQLFATQKTLEAQYHTQALWIAQQALDQLSASSTLRAAYPGNNTNRLSLSGTTSCPETCQDSSNTCNATALQAYFEGSLQCLAASQPYKALMPGGTLLIRCADTSTTVTGSTATAQQCTAQVDWDVPMMNYRNRNNAALGATQGRVELRSWTAI